MAISSSNAVDIQAMTQAEVAELAKRLENDEYETPLCCS